MAATALSDLLEEFERVSAEYKKAKARGVEAARDLAALADAISSRLSSTQPAPPPARVLKRMPRHNAPRFLLQRMALEALKVLPNPVRTKALAEAVIRAGYPLKNQRSVEKQLGIIIKRGSRSIGRIRRQGFFLKPMPGQAEAAAP